jgi:hypothetical protein
MNRLSIKRSEPAFGEKSFGEVGCYELIGGEFIGELDVDDARNNPINDLKLAKRNSAGKVEYSVDFCILRPKRLDNWNGKLIVEVTNRGNRLFGPLNAAPRGNGMDTPEKAGDAFFLSQGYCVAWNGWDPSAKVGDERLTARLPIALQPDGSSITGVSYEYIVFEEAGVLQADLSYPADLPRKSGAVLTKRKRLNDIPQRIPDEEWDFRDERSLRLLPIGTPFERSAIYELVYTARDPVVGGIGFAATRDFISFLQQAGPSNPLVEAPRRVCAYAVSQAARYWNDFLHLGFNRGRSGEQVVDGALTWLGGASGVALNLLTCHRSTHRLGRQPGPPFFSSDEVAAPDGR